MGDKLKGKVAIVTGAGSIGPGIGNGVIKGEPSRPSRGDPVLGGHHQLVSVGGGVEILAGIPDHRRDDVVLDTPSDRDHPLHNREPPPLEPLEVLDVVHHVQHIHVVKFHLDAKSADNGSPLRSRRQAPGLTSRRAGRSGSWR